jgi:hypothetical protein
MYGLRHGLRLSAATLTLVLIAMAAEAQDLHIKKNVSVGGYVASTMETSIKGARTRDISQTAAGNTITLRQCDLKQTVTINEQAQTYFVAKDPQDPAAARAAALATGAPVVETAGGRITVTSTVTDTGERKTLYGFPARHLKIKVTEESSEKACSQVHQNFDIDGWYADVSKELSTAGCNVYAPPVQQTQGCQDTIVEHHTGSGKAGYPLSQTITMPSPDGPTTVTIAVSEISKQPLDKSLFEVPDGYKQVSSLAELRGVPQMAQAPAGATQPTWGQPNGQAGGVPPGMGNGAAQNPRAGMANPLAGVNPQTALNPQAMMNAQAMMNPYAAGGRGGMPGMPSSQATGAPIAIPQALGPKAAGMIRIGVAPPDAQVGQGSNAGADYSTPIRNAMILLMNGPAVEVAALDSHVPLQLQAEAQQKQCDYILFSSVVLKHNAGGFGKFAKMGSMAASMTPMGMMAHGVGSAVAASAASAAAQAAQQQAMSQVMSQLQGFNGQIKSKDDVNVQYQLMAPGQQAPVLQNALQGKAKSDGEDVLTPLLQQTANTVVGQVGKK